MDGEPDEKEAEPVKKTGYGEIKKAGARNGAGIHSTVEKGIKTCYNINVTKRQTGICRYNEMAQNCYTTSEIASIVGIHVNTVRLYEDIGFITKPERQKNGYRIYTQLHLEQCRLVRRAMKAEVLQNGLRKKAVEIVSLCAALDFDGAHNACVEYRHMVEREYSNAKWAIHAVEDIMQQKTPSDTVTMKRREAADMLHITSETLRTWERSGLLSVKRSENGYRIYDAADMQRLNIIRTLRCANYSLSSILRLLNDLDRNRSCCVEDVLNTPRSDEDIISVCDQLIISLQSTLEDANAMIRMIEKIKSLH